MSKSRLKKLALAALCTAVIAACAWVSIPTPWGINLAFSLFGVCLASFLLGAKGALAATIAYILIGAVGLPVFSLFSGGVGVLVGPSGGFLWGFILLALICGLAKETNKKMIKYLLMVVSVLCCHFIGVVQFSLVTGNNLWVAFLAASLPFLVKDLLLVFLAEYVSKKIKI